MTLPIKTTALSLSSLLLQVESVRTFLTSHFLLCERTVCVNAMKCEFSIEINLSKTIRVLFMVHSIYDNLTIQIDQINKLSPTSVKVTLRQIQEGKKLDKLEDCLRMEYR